MLAFEENEISIKAHGGTEIAKRKLAQILDENLLKEFQIVCSRPREFDWSKIRLFWLHDLPFDPESKKFKDKQFLDSFHKFIFISNWQYQMYQLVHGLPYDTKSIVLETGIEPAFDGIVSNKIIEAKDTEKIRLVYMSTPVRGLDILIAAFTELAKAHSDIHLDVFSSFKIYGWDDYDKQFEELYDAVRNHPQMTYHGFVPNDELKKHLNKSHIFAYPCTWLETSCRAMLEAMSAGLLCVHPNFGALAESSGGLNAMYHGHHDKNEHANIFASHLNSAIRFVKSGSHKNTVLYNKTYVDTRYNIERVKIQWEAMLKDLLKQYSTIESRSKPKEMFEYKI